MKRTVEPAPRLRGRLIPPGDKSISHRAIILNSLATGSAELSGLSRGLDVAASIACMRELGAQIESPDRDVTTVHGCGLHGLSMPAGELDAANSGTTARLIAGVLAAQPWEVILTGDASLRRRPMERIAEPLRLMGARIETTRGCLPMRVTGGNLQAIDYLLPVASAQVKSALLLAGLFATGRTVVGERVGTRNHTEIALLEMGCDLVAFQGTCSILGPVKRLRARSMHIPGDISAAAFWLAAAAAHPDAEIEIERVGLNPSRGGIFSVLQAMGAAVEIERGPLEAGEAVGTVRVRGGALSGIAIGPELVPHVIDELPVIAVIATQAVGLTRITGASELRVKESDRIQAVVDALRSLGARIRELEDGMEIEGPVALAGGQVSAGGDHRMAMALAVAGLLATEPVEIEGSDTVDISYPEFWQDLESLL